MKVVTEPGGDEAKRQIGRKILFNESTMSIVHAM